MSGRREEQRRNLGSRLFMTKGVIISLALLLLGGVIAPNASAHSNHPPSWNQIPIASTTTFKGLSPVSRKVVWLDGVDGTVWRTTNGRDFVNVSPPPSEDLGFYDIAGFSAREAVAMAGNAIYVTNNGGKSWHITYADSDPSVFFDCMSFSDRQHGLVVTDPIDGKFRILSTRDGGRSWTVLPTAGMPEANATEFAWGTSGECLATVGHYAWFGTGGSDGARVFHSTDSGLTWSVSTPPVVAAPLGGIFGLAFKSGKVGITVGGDGDQLDRAIDVAATTTSGGKSWRKPATGPAGLRAGVTFVPGTRSTALAVGATGSDISYDNGKNWSNFASGAFYTVVCSPGGSCWASGPDGRLANLRE
jgi:photosystem II stability/assembly factor-like uncharacterized protein